jgi:hypothetical protein
MATLERTRDQPQPSLSSQTTSTSTFLPSAVPTAFAPPFHLEQRQEEDLIDLGEEQLFSGSRQRTTTASTEQAPAGVRDEVGAGGGVERDVEASQVRPTVSLSSPTAWIDPSLPSTRRNFSVLSVLHDMLSSSPSMGCCSSTSPTAAQHLPLSTPAPSPLPTLSPNPLLLFFLLSIETPSLPLLPTKLDLNPPSYSSPASWTLSAAPRNVLPKLPPLPPLPALPLLPSCAR